MAVTTTLSNHYKYMLLTNAIDMDNDLFKVILMVDTFVFDPDSHATLADVTASQLATGNGYTQNTATLTKTAPVIEDDAQDLATIAWDDVQWTATGGIIGPFKSAIIYDDTTVDKTVFGHIDLGAPIQVADGNIVILRGLSLEI